MCAHVQPSGSSDLAFHALDYKPLYDLLLCSGPKKIGTKNQEKGKQHFLTCSIALH